VSILETTIETKACEYAKSLGITAKKLFLASERSWPDRTFLYRGHVMFIEFKQLKEKAEPLQQYTINLLRQNGFVVYICDNLAQSKVLIKEWREYVDNHQ